MNGNIGHVKFMTKLVYASMLITQTFLFYMVVGGIIEGGNNPDITANFQILSLAPASLSLVYFFILFNDERIVTKTLKYGRSYEVYRNEVFTGWVSSWAFAQAVIILGFMGYIANGISVELFVVSYLASIGLTAFLHPRLDRLSEKSIEMTFDAYEKQSLNEIEVNDLDMSA